MNYIIITINRFSEINFQSQILTPVIESKLVVKSYFRDDQTRGGSLMSVFYFFIS